MPSATLTNCLEHFGNFSRKKIIFNRLMKRFLILISLCWSMLQASAQFTSASLQASGVTCSLCSKAIQKALEKVPFVQLVTVDVKAQLYNVIFKNNSVVHFDDIQKAVEDAGFSVSSLKVTGNFDNLQLPKNENIRIGDQTFHFLNGNGQILNGEKTFTLIDKDFLTPKAFKKYSASIRENAGSNIRVFHVII
jgi:copper chaperone CopZ